jgi:hypothetical protein
MTKPDGTAIESAIEGFAQKPQRGSHWRKWVATQSMLNTPAFEVPGLFVQSRD